MLMCCAAPYDAPQGPEFGHFQGRYLGFLSGADDGIRTRDPHLGNKFRCELPTCTYTNSRSMIGVFG